MRVSRDESHLNDTGVMNVAPGSPSPIAGGPFRGSGLTTAGGLLEWGLGSGFQRAEGTVRQEETR